MTRWLVPLAVLFAACGTPAVDGGDPVVDLHEFSIGIDGGFQSGTNNILVNNQGEFGHTLVIADSTGKVVDATGVIAGGESTSFEVDLLPGSYEFSCRIVLQTGDGTLVDHYHEGMTTTVEVRDA